MSSTKNGLLKVVAVSGIDGRTAGTCVLENETFCYLTGLEEGIAFFVSAVRYASGKSFASKFSEPIEIITCDPGKLNEGHRICTLRLKVNSNIKNPLVLRTVSQNHYC